MVQKFCKGDETLEDEERGGWPSEVDNNQPRASSKLILTTTQEVAKELDNDHSTIKQPLKQIEKVKKLSKYVPRELTKNKKTVISKCRLLLFCAATMIGL